MRRSSSHGPHLRRWGLAQTQLCTASHSHQWPGCTDSSWMAPSSMAPYEASHYKDYFQGLKFFWFFLSDTYILFLKLTKLLSTSKASTDHRDFVFFREHVDLYFTIVWFLTCIINLFISEKNLSLSKFSIIWMFGEISFLQYSSGRNWNFYFMFLLDCKLFLVWWFKKIWSLSTDYFNQLLNVYLFSVIFMSSQEFNGVLVIFRFFF